MPEGRKLSAGPRSVLPRPLSVLALLVYAAMIATLANLAGGQRCRPATAMAQGFAAIEIILSLAGAVRYDHAHRLFQRRHAAPRGGVRVPSGAGLRPQSRLEVLELLSRPYQPPHLWPLIIPAAVPLLVLAYCFWSLVPPLRAAISARVASGVILGLAFVLCAAIVPFDKIRQCRRRSCMRPLSPSTKPTSPRSRPMRRCGDAGRRSSTRETPPNLSEMLKHIAMLERRQADAELMLDRGATFRSVSWDGSI